MQIIDSTSLSSLNISNFAKVCSISYKTGRWENFGVLLITASFRQTVNSNFDYGCEVKYRIAPNNRYGSVNEITLDILNINVIENQWLTAGFQTSAFWVKNTEQQTYDVYIKSIMPGFMNLKFEAESFANIDIKHYCIFEDISDISNKNYCERIPNPMYRAYIYAGSDNKDLNNFNEAGDYVFVQATNLENAPVSNINGLLTVHNAPSLEHFRTQTLYVRQNDTLYYRFYDNAWREVLLKKDFIKRTTINSDENISYLDLSYKTVDDIVCLCAVFTPSATDVGTVLITGLPHPFGDNDTPFLGKDATTGANVYFRINYQGNLVSESALNTSHKYAINFTYVGKF